MQSLLASPLIAWSAYLFDFDHHQTVPGVSPLAFDVKQTGCLQCMVVIKTKPVVLKVNHLMEILKQPYKEQKGCEAYTEAAPVEVRMGVECLSCSS